MAAPVRKKTTQRKRTTNRGNKPDYERELSTLFQILGNENQILMRTDQKAFTLLSIGCLYGFLHRSLLEGTDDLVHFPVCDGVFCRGSD